MVDHIFSLLKGRLGSVWFRLSVMSHTGVYALASLGKSFDENKPTIGPGTVIGGMMSKSSLSWVLCLSNNERVDGWNLQNNQVFYKLRNTVYACIFRIAVHLVNQGKYKLKTHIIAEKRMRNRKGKGTFKG